MEAGDKLELLEVVGTLKLPSTRYTMFMNDDAIFANDDKKNSKECYSSKCSEDALCILPSGKKVAWCSGLYALLLSIACASHPFHTLRSHTQKYRICFCLLVAYSGSVKKMHTFAKPILASVWCSFAGVAGS